MRPFKPIEPAIPVTRMFEHVNNPNTGGGCGIYSQNSLGRTECGGRYRREPRSRSPALLCISWTKAGDEHLPKVYQIGQQLNLFTQRSRHSSSPSAVRLLQLTSSMWRPDIGSELRINFDFIACTVCHRICFESVRVDRVRAYTCIPTDSACLSSPSYWKTPEASYLFTEHSRSRHSGLPTSYNVFR